MSPVIRVDREVKARLDAERRPGERNYNEALLRLLAEARLAERPRQALRLVRP